MIKRETLERHYYGNFVWRLIKTDDNYLVECQPITLAKEYGKHYASLKFFRRVDAAAYIQERTTRKNRS